MITGYRNLEYLKEELDSCSLRRTLADVVDMPEKIVSFETLELSDAHMHFYQTIKKGVKDEALKIELNTANLLALTTRLRQAAVLPSILTNENVESTKIERCLELTEELIQQNEKVVIFSNFKQPLEILAKRLISYNPLLCTGDYSESDVVNNVEKFQNDPTSLICLCTHARMGTGFTLNAAAYCIMLDIPFTYSALDQSICRLYRLNNTRSCYVKILCGKDTIDERVQQLVETKKDLGNYLIDGIISNSLGTILKEMLLN